MKKLLKKTVMVAGIITLISTGAQAVVLKNDEIKGRGSISFSTYDQDGNSFIDEKEFYDVKGKRAESRAEEGRRMRKAENSPNFEDFDADKNGKITKEELIEGQQKRFQENRGSRGKGQKRRR